MDARLRTALLAHLRTWRPYTLWYVGLVGLGGAVLATDRHSVPLLVAAWLTPTLVWIAAHYLGDYLDRDLDAISKPQRPIPSGQLRPGTALACGVALSVVAAVVAVSADRRTAILLAIGIGGAVAYNGVFKARGLWGNVVRGALTGAAFLFGQMVAGGWPRPGALLFVVVFWAHDAASNLVGTLRDVNGDGAGGYVTFAVRRGLRTAARTAAGLYALALAAAVAAVPVVPGSRPGYLGTVLLAALLGGYAFRPLLTRHGAVGRFSEPARASPAIERIALRSHEILVAERVVLAGALLVAGLGGAVAAAIVLPLLLVTVAVQRSMRSRHELAPEVVTAGPVLPPRVVDSRVDAALLTAAEALFAAQRPDGSWPNERPTAVLGTAGAVTALHLADPHRSRDLIENGVRWLVAAQNPDGGWGGVAGAPTQLVPTVVAAAALHLLRPLAPAEAIERGLARVASLGGPAALADPGMAHLTRTFLGLAGAPGADTGAPARRIPLELLLLPRRLWRGRLSFRLAPFVAMAFVQAGHRPPAGAGRLRYRLGRRAGLRALAEVESGENDRGGYGGDNWLVAVVCIGLTRAGAPGGMIRDTVEYLRGNVAEDGSWHIMQGLDLIGGSYVAAGLAEAGHGDDPRLARARGWLAGCQQDRPFPVFGAPAGGWGWEGPRGWPNFLDSANVLAALVTGAPDHHLRTGLRWLASRQDRAGSWGTFVPDTTLPNDGPCPYVTAQAVEVLLAGGARPADPRIRRALDWLLARQDPDGTYPALWYRGRTAGTAMVLLALGRAGLAGHPVAERARAALLRGQLPDGSWGPGETGIAGDDPARGTVEETAWALRGLVAAGVPVDVPALRRAADWIIAAQRPDGRWPAAPVCMHIREAAYYVDGLIVDGLALKALAAYRTALSGAALTGQEAA